MIDDEVSETFLGSGGEVNETEHVHVLGKASVSENGEVSANENATYDNNGDKMLSKTLTLLVTKYG